MISQVLNEVPTPLREIRPEVSEELEAIVAKAMAKDRTQRYEDADAMLKDLTLLLEDPTHSTERAKITGPRRRFQKAPKIPKLAWAVGGTGIAIGLVMLAVVLLMNSGNSPRAKDAKQVLPPPARPDAGLVEPDAAPVEPPVATIKLQIVTTPPGAMVYRESELVGKSPVSIELVNSNKNVHITAQLDGYNDATSDINPVERTDGATIKLRLTKLPKNAPHVKRVPPGSGSGAGSAIRHSGTAGGELTGYPPQ